MFGFMKSPGSVSFKKSPADSGGHGGAGNNPFESDSGSHSASGYSTFDCGSELRGSSANNYNPFDSDSEAGSVTSKVNVTPVARRNSSELAVVSSKFSNPDRNRSGNQELGGIERKLSMTVTSRIKRTSTTGRQTSCESVVTAPGFVTLDKKGSVNQGPDGKENQSVKELEDYALRKAQETNDTIKSCLRIAEDTRGTAMETIETLHHQGQQIRRIHHMAVDMDRDLSRGEKILGSLGSMFSRSWKPKKGRDITGLFTMEDNKLGSSQHNKEHRENLGVAEVPKVRSTPQTLPPGPTNAFQKLQIEKDRQDDALSDLSNVLGELKDMALKMGSEFERQNEALDHFSDDVDELNFRMKGANQHTRRLLGK